MPDETIEILIKTVMAGDGMKLTAQEMERVASATGRTTEEMRKLAEQWERTNRARAAVSGASSAAGVGYDPSRLRGAIAQQAEQERLLRGGYSGPLPPVILSSDGGGAAVPAGETGGGGMGYGMRRHFGAVAGQVLGMPGLGMAAAIGGIAGGIGVAVIAMEKLLNVFREWYDKLERVRTAGTLWDTVKDRIQSVGEVQRDLNREQDLFNQSLTHTRELVRSTTAQIARMKAVQEFGADMAVKEGDAAFAVERVNILLSNRVNIIGQIQQLAALDERTAQRALERQAEAEDRNIKRLTKQMELATERRAKNEEALGAEQDLMKEQRLATQAERENQAPALQILQDRYDAYEKLRQAAVAGMQGKATAPFSFYAAKAGLAAMGEQTPSGDMSYEQIRDFAMGKQGAISGLKFAAEERIRERQAEEALTNEQLQHTRQQIRTARKDEETAELELETARQERQLREQSAPVILQRQQQSIETRSELDVLNAIQGGGAIPGSGGSASTSPVLQKLDALIQLGERQLAMWG